MWVLGLSVVARGKSTSSGEMLVCNEISLQIQADFLRKGKEAPSAWGDLPGVKRIREGKLHQNIEGLSTYNKFAMVPEAPKILAASDIPWEYVGMHLYLIQRDTEPVGIYSYAGRAAILMGPETA